MVEYLVTYGQDLTIAYTQATAVGNINVSFVDAEYGDEVYAVGVTPTTPGNYSIVLPGVVNNCDRVYLLSVYYTNSSSQAKIDKFYFNTRRPYVTTTELASELGLTIDPTPSGPTEITQAKLQQLERYASARINALTVNNFNITFNRNDFDGTGKSVIATDDNIVSVEKAWVNDDLAFDASGDGSLYGIEVVPNDGGNGFKLVFDDEVSVISSPYVAETFNPSYKYKMQYLSGYQTVPEAIRQATVLLANEYLCGDYGQRNHYVTKIETQLGKTEYSDMTFSGTGNVSVDQLITPYVRIPMQVI